VYLYGRNIEAEIEKAKQLRAEHLRGVFLAAKPVLRRSWSWRQLLTLAQPNARRESRTA
jgi:hypothetical protein